MQKITGIIPARYNSRRFPGKPLAILGGVPIIVRVMNQALKSATLQSVIVATDDRRIADVVAAHGGKAVLTDGVFSCGSERVAAVARALDTDLVVNIQADEPFLAPEVIDSVVHQLVDVPGREMSTACCPLYSPAEADDPNVVKVVLAKDGRALYFSRSRIPYGAGLAKEGQQGKSCLYRHIGVYGFTNGFLQRFAAYGRSPLEMAEDLEQLRALEHGHAIYCAIVRQQFAGIDTIDDLRKAEQRLLELG